MLKVNLVMDLRNVHGNVAFVVGDNLGDKVVTD